MFAQFPRTYRIVNRREYSFVFRTPTQLFAHRIETRHVLKKREHVYAEHFRTSLIQHYSVRSFLGCQGLVVLLPTLCSDTRRMGFCVGCY